MLEFGINIPAERPCTIPSLQLRELKCCGSLLCFAVLRGPELFPRTLSALRAANAASMQAAINSELASRGAELALLLAQNAPDVPNIEGSTAESNSTRLAIGIWLCFEPQDSLKSCRCKASQFLLVRLLRPATGPRRA